MQAPIRASSCERLDWPGVGVGLGEGDGLGEGVGVLEADGGGVELSPPQAVKAKANTNEDTNERPIDSISPFSP